MSLVIRNPQHGGGKVYTPPHDLSLTSNFFLKNEDLEKEYYEEDGKWSTTKIEERV